MAFDEDLIDFMNRLPAVAGRRTRPERRFELRSFCGLAPHPPAGETPGLARQILERELEGMEPPAEAFGIDQAIGRGNGSGHGLGRWPEIVHPGIRPEEKDTRGMLGVFNAVLAQLRVAPFGDLSGAIPDLCDIFALTWL